MILLYYQSIWNSKNIRLMVWITSLLCNLGFAHAHWPHASSQFKGGVSRPTTLRQIIKDKTTKPYSSQVAPSPASSPAPPASCLLLLPPLFHLQPVAQAGGPSAPSSSPAHCTYLQHKVKWNWRKNSVSWKTKTAKYWQVSLFLILLLLNNFFGGCS